MSEALLVTVTDDNKHTVTSIGKPLPNTEVRILDLSTRAILQPFEKVNIHPDSGRELLQLVSFVLRSTHSKRFDPFPVSG